MVDKDIREGRCQKVSLQQFSSMEDPSRARYRDRSVPLVDTAWREHWAISTSKNGHFSIAPYSGSTQEQKTGIILVGTLLGDGIQMESGEFSMELLLTP